MNYTGINKLIQSESLQKFIDKKDDGTFSEFFADWKWIITYSKRYKGYVLLYTLFGLFASTFNVASSYASALAINLITSGTRDKLALILCLMFGTQLFYIGFNAIRNRIMSNITINVHKDIQAEIFDSIMDVRWDELNKYKHGDLLNRFNSDVKTVSDNAISWIPDILINIYNFVLTLVVLFSMDPIMAAIGLCSAPILFFMSRYVLKRQRKHRLKVLELDSEMMSFETETFYNMDTVKSFGVWDVLSKRLRNWQVEYTSTNKKYNLFQIKTNTSLSLLNMLVSLGSLCYCLYRLWNGKILYGDMTFFLNQRSALTYRFDNLISIVPGMLNAAVSTHRIKEIIELPKEDHDSQSYENVLKDADKGLTIELNNASFSYVEDRHVYEDANFVAKPGEIVAVISESGGGKTTLFRLLLGLVNAQKGDVVLKDGNGEIVKMNADLRKLISYVPQGNTIFMGSIADNLRMVKDDASDEELIAALKTACAWEFIEPIGINSNLGEKGKGLSEGQVQRISIARAILRDAPILFLDEATSALDEQTEARVIDNVVNSSPNRTIIVSSHRPSILKKCTRVYRIKNKQIVMD